MGSPLVAGYALLKNQKIPTLWWVTPPGAEPCATFRRGAGYASLPVKGAALDLVARRWVLTHLACAICKMVAGAAFESAAIGYEPIELPHTLPGNVKFLPPP